MAATRPRRRLPVSWEPRAQPTAALASSPSLRIAASARTRAFERSRRGRKSSTSTTAPHRRRTCLRAAASARWNWCSHQPPLAALPPPRDPWISARGPRSRSRRRAHQAARCCRICRRSSHWHRLTMTTTTTTRLIAQLRLEAQRRTITSLPTQLSALAVCRPWSRCGCPASRPGRSALSSAGANCRRLYPSRLLDLQTQSVHAPVYRYCRGPCARHTHSTGFACSRESAFSSLRHATSTCTSCLGSCKACCRVSSRISRQNFAARLDCPPQ
jgi:hypothetical protein